MGRWMRRGLVACLAVLLIVQGALVAAADFEDVPAADWAFEHVTLLEDMGIVNGYPDGTYRPDRTLSRGEFIKMLVCAVAPDALGPADDLHFAANYLDAAVAVGITTYTAVPRTSEALDAAITRYEMAQMIASATLGCMGEDAVATEGIQDQIPDFAAIPADYQAAVLQAYGKGIFTGYEDGSFQGTRALTRREAAAVVVRLICPDMRVAVDLPTDGSNFEIPEGYVPVALRSTAEFNEAVFGDANTTWHPSYEDASARYVDVTVNVWRLASDGSKYTDTETITVNQGVAAEVVAIFDMIFNGAEQFPIRTIHTTRINLSDTRSEHMWGVAIDINANENYYCYKDGTAITGSHWLPGEDPYSILPDGDVVRAFAAFGWGWGGEGWWSTTNDYMHFSVTGT